MIETTTKPDPGEEASLEGSPLEVGGEAETESNAKVEELKQHKLVPPDDGKRHLSQVGGSPLGGQFGGVPLAGLLSAEDRAAGEVGEARADNNSETLVSKDEAAIQEDIQEALRTIYDPEIPVNIVDLGLIYDVAVDPQQNVEISMTLTAPACPVAGMIVRRVANKVGGLEAVRSARVSLTWDPPWSTDLMSDEAKLELGLL